MKNVIGVMTETPVAPLAGRMEVTCGCVVEGAGPVVKVLLNWLARWFPAKSVIFGLTTTVKVVLNGR
jgi:hypothetical protein